ncbi:type II toxin-antitoxin system VapB family antitoxin [Streptomyces sp. ST2-7A]|uniref:type II toxin-antitoxin system VapB family antitoxin n=1 Tax=Streptomyces sp. ST2-7A TaxID=2907214 RepID=UPI001F269C4B|nr:type II toxin-antitoxin system VapB family antitoxin [Streptomyces sp. ST2-7A]MCE7081996.1 type II toxin-antitoxin system VapB family antitoxin [Streptomyces sp. ST2-7A]
MAKMLIDIDEETLAAAQEALGTRTKKETVNTALSETAARIRRAKALAEARRLIAEGALDMAVLSDKTNYRASHPRQEAPGSDA